ncbi:YggS family pyridoxal phosphate-dependent enzyme [Legionella sp. W05-934-2]|jgi:pyridoxal phosphate enzyme (YggS family)|uniref:YggS family pyridoxal phosphate-dependent enzyme n=1 Tax=Legionella sp. W05-934-2 TaxID=1198649 RepID=UPI0034630AED
MATIVHNLAFVNEQIKRALLASHRSPNEVMLLAVSKTKPASAIREAYQAGQRAFGENYVQEALDKMNQLADLAIEWHFIGSIQSKKSAYIAQHFSWVHTVDRIKVAKLLNQCRPHNMPPLNICIQVNLDNESSKSGVSITDCLPLATQIKTMENLSLRGLMAIPKPQTSSEAQFLSFRRLTNLKQDLSNQLGCPLDTLSMGMSSDLTAAIRAGSTIVRVGEAIFGARE